MEHPDVVVPVLKSGYLPPPAGTEEFQLTHASVDMFQAIGWVTAIRMFAAISILWEPSPGFSSPDDFHSNETR